MSGSHRLHPRKRALRSGAIGRGKTPATHFDFEKTEKRRSQVGCAAFFCFTLSERN